METQVLYKMFTLCKYNDFCIEEVEEIYDRLDKNQKTWFEKHLKSYHYRYKYLGKSRCAISKNAVMLSKKIKEELNNIVFPVVTTCTRRGWGTDGGTWAWAMDLYPLGDIGSADPVRICIQKQYELIDINYNGEIVAEKRSSRKGEVICLA